MIMFGWNVSGFGSKANRVTCTDTAPTSVLIATPDGTPNNALMIQFTTVLPGSPDPPILYSLEKAHGATLDLSVDGLIGQGGPPPAVLLDPNITILASSESSGGDATDTHSWELTSNQDANCIRFTGQTTATTEDIGGGQGFTFTYNEDNRIGTAQITLAYTGSNCGGLAIAVAVVITIQD